jgi:threonine dehydrogenase-like Zn-dependent dehydrogenase
MRAVVFEGAGRTGLQERDAPLVEGSLDVLVQVETNGICGSDLRALEVPPQLDAVPGVVVGHEFVGVVRGVGDAVSSLRVGDRMVAMPTISCGVCWFCRRNEPNRCDSFEHVGFTRDGGAAEYCVVPERAALRLPDGIDPELAALTEPLACVLNGTQRAAVHPGESVVVMGAGPVGLMFVLLFAAAGAAPIVVSEPSARRAAMALDLGADAVVDPRSGDVSEAVRSRTAGRGADVAVDTVGRLLSDAVGCVRKGGRVLTFGLDQTARANLSIADITSREITIAGVYVANGTFPLAVDLLMQNRLGFQRLVTHRAGLESYTDMIGLLRTGEATKALVSP